MQMPILPDEDNGSDWQHHHMRSLYRFITFPNMELAVDLNTSSAVMGAALALTTGNASTLDQTLSVINNLSSSSGASVTVWDKPSPQGVVPFPAGSKPWPLFKQPSAMVIGLSLAYIVVFVLGLVNNSLVVSVIYRNPQLRTVTNYFIANLAVADILVCILVLPITLLSNIFTEWWYGPVLCKMFPYLHGVAVSASVNTLAAVAIERYLAIFYPVTNRMSPRCAFIMIGCIWLLPMGIFIPWVMVYTLIYHTTAEGFVAVLCTADWDSLQHRRLYTLGAVFLTCYLVPLLFIAVCYLLIGVRVWKRRVRGMRGTRTERNIYRHKIRIVRMLMVVFIMFSLSWLPLYALELRFLFGPSLERGTKLYNLIRLYLLPFAQWLGSANSCINPFIYCYFSTSFRRSILVAVRSRSCCGKISV